MKTSSMARAVVTIVALATLGGCETLTPRLDQQFGDAVNMARARQTLDRDAAARNANKTAAGIDGSAAKEIVDRYEKSFRTPEPAPNVFAIGVSGASSGMPSQGQ